MNQWNDYILSEGRFNENFFPTNFFPLILNKIDLTPEMREIF